MQTSAPSVVQTHAPTRVQTSAPTRVSTTIHPTVVQTSAPHPVQTSAPTRVQTSAPHPVQTSAPHPVQTSAPHPVQTSAPTTVQTSALHPVQSSALHPVQSSAPTRVQTSAPTRVSTTIHPTVVQTSAPTTVLTTIHPTVVQTHAPTIVRTHAPTTVPAPPTNYNIVISPHIKIIIQNVKYSRKRSYEHIDNLFRKLKNYNDDYTIYKQLLLTRYHIRQHYITILHDIRKLLYSTNTHHDHNNTEQTPHFVLSMQKLDNSIKRIEQSIHFIKGNHKYILLNILHKLKLQYQTDTQRLLHKWNNDFN